jgi:hypothetical protein
VKRRVSWRYAKAQIGAVAPRGKKKELQPNCRRVTYFISKYFTSELRIIGFLDFVHRPVL